MFHQVIARWDVQHWVELARVKTMDLNSTRKNNPHFQRHQDNLVYCSKIMIVPRRAICSTIIICFKKTKYQSSSNTSIALFLRNRKIKTSNFNNRTLNPTIQIIIMNHLRKQWKWPGLKKSFLHQDSFLNWVTMNTIINMITWWKPNRQKYIMINPSHHIHHLESSISKNIM